MVGSGGDFGRSRNDEATFQGGYKNFFQTGLPSARACEHINPPRGFSLYETRIRTSPASNRKGFEVEEFRRAIPNPWLGEELGLEVLLILTRVEAGAVLPEELGFVAVVVVEVEIQNWSLARKKSGFRAGRVNLMSPIQVAALS